MTQHKATKIRTYHDKNMDHVEYEYRGRKYEVTYAKAWTMSITPAKVQHRDAQARIDAEIEAEKNKGRDAQEGLDLFFEYFG